MGYYTKFELYIYHFDTNQPLDFDEQDKIFDEISKEYDLDEDSRMFSEKWYNREEDMIEFSKKYPDLLFELCGYGEDEDDFWNDYFHNGKYQHCQGKIVYEQYRKEELI